MSICLWPNGPCTCLTGCRILFMESRFNRPKAPVEIIEMDFSKIEDRVLKYLESKKEFKI